MLGGMLWSRPTVPDDRGRRVELFTASIGSATEDPELVATVGRVYESATLLHERVRLIHVLAILMGVIIMVLVVVLARYLTWLPPAMTGVLMAAWWILMGLIIAMQSRRRFANRTAESILRIGRCPSCGYRLAGTPEDAEGLVTCPECASGWKPTRVGVSAVSKADIPARPDTPGDMAPVSWSLKRMWVRLPTIVDDRDRSMSLTDPRLPRLEATVGAVRAADVRLAMSKRLRLLKQGWGALTLVGVAIMCAPALFMTMGARFGAGRWVIGYMAVFWGYTAARMLYRLAKGTSRLLAKPTLLILVEHRVCPACAADLKSCEPEADGCVVCGACRAAWKLQESRDQDSMRKTTRV